MLLFRSRHLALNSPLGHFNGDNARLLPNLPDTQKPQWLQSSFPSTETWLSLNYGEHNPSHVRRYALSFSTLSYLHFVSSLTCSTNANYIFHAENKNHSLKTHFDYRHLTSSPFLYYLTNLARKQQQSKHTHVYNPSSLTKQPNLSLKN